MKERSSLIWELALLFLLTCSQTVYGGDKVDRLLDLLQAKGIISEQEVTELKKEIDEPEPAPQPAAAPVTTQAVSKKDPPFMKVKGKVDFSGDLRLRYDTQRRDEGPGKDDINRKRPRYRLRFGVSAEPTDSTEVGLSLASGNGFQNTTNQSFDEHFRGKKIFIDRVYAGWKPAEWLNLVAGKQENPFFTSSLVWDPDVNPEGLTEQLAFNGENAQFFANLTQFVTDELNLKAKSNRDPYMLGYQVGGKIKPSGGTSLQLGLTFYDFRNLDVVPTSGLGDSSTFQGYNHTHGQQMVYDANGSLLNEFNTLELGGKFTTKDPLPTLLTFFGYYINNTAADVDLLRENGTPIPGSDPLDLSAYLEDDRDMGYQVGLELGYREKKGDLSLQYFYQVLEDYSFPAVFTDSDFHGGGTNNRGHRARVSYFFTDSIYLQGLFFFTKRDAEMKDGQRDENRLILDLLFEF